MSDTLISLASWGVSILIIGFVLYRVIVIVRSRIKK